LAKNINKEKDEKPKKAFEYNSYAKEINSTAQLARRHQGIDKITDFGLGVIYVWDWKWSYSTTLYDRDLELPDKANYGLNGENGRYSGRFMYLGLSIQSPTSARMGAHIQDAKIKQSIEYLALGQAIYNNFDVGGQERRFKDAESVPKIIHICSLFDLATLEKYFITDLYKLNQGKKGYQTFADLVSDANSLKKSSLSGVTGVNTESGGQGGPMKGITSRDKREWVMAAYYFLKETDNTVLASRDGQLNKIYDNAVKPKDLKGKQIKKTTQEKVMDIINGFVNSDIPKNITLDILRSIDLSVIEDTLGSLGVSNKDMLSRQFEGAVDKEGNLVETFDKKDYNINIPGFTYEDGSLGMVLSQILSFDISQGETKTGLRKLLVRKGEVRAELRDVVFKNVLENVPKDPAKLEQYSINMKTVLGDLSVIAETFFSSSYDIGRIRKQIRESGDRIQKAKENAETKMLQWGKDLAVLKAEIFTAEAIKENLDKKPSRVGALPKNLTNSKIKLTKKEKELEDIVNTLNTEVHTEERKVAEEIIKANKKIKAAKQKPKQKAG
jgi:hypothetical protein